MLTFRVAPPASAPVGDNAPEGTDIEFWQDADGQVIAWAWHTPNDYHFEVSGVATYAFDAIGGTVVGCPLNGARPGVVRDTFYRAVLPFLLHATGLETFHASAIVAHERVFAFCAPSGTGKSTLADAFRHRGYAVWSDDCLIITPGSDVVLTLPIPFHIRLAKAGPAWVNNRAGAGNDDATPDRFDAWNGPALPLGALFVLKRNQGNHLGAQLTRLTPAATLEQLLTHAYTFADSPSDRRRMMMARLLDIVETVPTYQLVLPDSAEKVSDVLDLLEPRLAAIHPLRSK